MNNKRTQISILIVIVTAVFPCNGVSLLQQLEHIARRRLESRGEHPLTRRVFFSFDRGEVTNIAGVPHSPKHLPIAEPILPGHTLIRPALGMLKSSLKFPHIDFEDGSGVYGSVDNIGLRYNGAIERVMYSDFRRRASDYLMVVPEKNIENQSKPRFKLLSTVLDLENKDTIKNLLQQLQRLNQQGNVNVIILTLLDASALKSLTEKSDSYYLNENRQSVQNDPQSYKTLGLRSVKPIRENLNLNNKLKEDLPDSNPIEEPNSEEDKPEDKEILENNAMKQKFVDMIKSMNAYNHIKISESAPDYATFMPAHVSSNLRDWWFFNEDDHKTTI